MAKFKIAPAPTFEAKVDIPCVGGPPSQVPFVFKYRDRIELANLYDTWRAKGKALQESIKEGEQGLAEVTAAQMELQVEQIQDLVVGWGFDDKLSPASILALVKTSSGAPDAVIAAYSEAFSRARLGN